MYSQLKQPYILAIDQGTTSTRAIVFDTQGNALSSSKQLVKQYFPDNGWVEHDPEEIWNDTIKVCHAALLTQQISAEQIAAIGIASQRETTVIWDRNSGAVVYNALVWQDRRTVAICQKLQAEGLEQEIQAKTGLLIDPYFSATKLMWLLDNVSGLRKRAERGELAFGTMDSFLLWRLTAGKVHATDATNAARTMLFNIHTQEWDKELLQQFAIPASLLPEVHDSSYLFGYTDKKLFGVELPITGIAGDQQAAMVGQACFEPGMVKATYGTGCFMLQNSGSRAVSSKHRLLTTVAYRLNGQVTYALEGCIFAAGTGVEWLRDRLKVITDSAETSEIARNIADTHGLYFVPAFNGLGAPYWDPDARGAIIGITRDSGLEHIVRAMLEAIAYQSVDLMRAMLADSAVAFKSLRIDGGIVKNEWLCQFLADMLAIKIERPKESEITALGVAFLAGLAVGIYPSLAEISKIWQAKVSFQSSIEAKLRTKLYAGWKSAVERVKTI
ncbi:MAG: glycerol kinase GlpK [Gammaproteobacteria bacterium]|nr:glycerol kinase GlpK [Gammaproteobacteria bacterium]